MEGNGVQLRALDFRLLAACDGCTIRDVRQGPDGLLYLLTDEDGGALLRIDHVVSAPRRPVVIDGLLRLGGPAEGLDTRIRRWLQAEAKLLFADDLAFYCARAKVALPTLALTNARSRWGSCSGKGIIRLNWRLVMAPDAVRRSVVAHEVAHLLHFDHSPRFHACLAQLFERDIEEANRWLKRHGRGIYGILG